MKSQEIAVYREIQRTTDMAMKAMDTITNKIYDDQLAMQISRQSLKYSELYNEASKQLLTAKAESYHNGFLEDFMLKAEIQYHTLLNTSTSHVAEMMIKGSHNGVLKMQKVLNHNEEASEKSVMLAKQFLDFEEKNISRLKKYL